MLVIESLPLGLMLFNPLNKWINIELLIGKHNLQQTLLEIHIFPICRKVLSPWLLYIIPTSLIQKIKSNCAAYCLFLRSGCVTLTGYQTIVHIYSYLNLCVMICTILFAVIHFICSSCQDEGKADIRFAYYSCLVF